MSKDEICGGQVLGIPFPELEGGLPNPYRQGEQAMWKRFATAIVKGEKDSGDFVLLNGIKLIAQNEKS